MNDWMAADEYHDERPLDETPLDGWDPERTDYITAGGLAIARARFWQGIDFEHSDHLGSPVAQTHFGHGGLKSHTRYTPFGIAMDDPDHLKDQGGFTGHIKDSATGLNYMQARYYDPVIGRFLSVDPQTMMSQNYDPRFFNRYAYTFNDPINLTDPNGECPWCVGAIVGGIAGALVGVATEATTAKLTGKDFTFGSALKAGLVGGGAGAVAGATGVGAAKLAADVGKLGKVAIAGGEVAANGLSAGAITAAGEAVTGGNVKAGFVNGAIGGSIGTAGGKAFEAATSLSTVAGEGIANGVNKALNFPRVGAVPQVLDPSVAGGIVGEAVGNSIGATFANGTCAVISDPC